MRILISVSYYAPHISGLTNSIKNLAEGLAHKGHTVNVLTTQHKKDLSLYETSNSVHIERVPYVCKFQKGFIMPRFLSRAFSSIQKTDVVLINLPQVEGILVALLGRLLGKKVVSVYACEVSLPKSFTSFFIEQFLFALHFCTLLLSDNVVALSEDYAEHSKLLKYFRSKTVGIYPYIKTPVIAERDRRALRARDDELYKIGYIGRISAEKGLEYLLEGIPLLQKELGDSFTIVIAGPGRAVGEEAYAEKIEKLSKVYKERVMFLSPIQDEALGDFYASLDVLVLPSINSTEAFGMVQVEAMLCGTPVVVSDLPGVRVPVQVTGMGEIFKVRDVKNLAENIIKVLKNKKSYVKDKKTIERYFSPESVISQYEEFFRHR